LGVRGLVLDRDGRVALVLHTYLDGWYLPGGGVNPGESYDQALARELREEIGLAAFHIERVLGVYHDTVTLKDDHVVAYVVRTHEPAPLLKTADPFEIQEARWFALASLPKDLSSATARRIEDYKAGVTGGGAW
jgi:ADP-ribose pyrophosphatase YjhB (NUDIX family)